MERLTCSRCTATTEADSIEEGRELLDHSIGLYIRKPCEDGKAELIWTGKVQQTPKVVKKQSIENSKDSISKKD